MGWGWATFLLLFIFIIFTLFSISPLYFPAYHFLLLYFLASVLFRLCGIFFNCIIIMPYSHLFNVWVVCIEEKTIYIYLVAVG